jgi:DNA repair protein RecN (Recombination protein N)
MLKNLSISNYALIDKVDLKFQKGLTAITGETGSGKSILLGAFGMLLGERADTKAIRDEKVKCIVEAVFDLKDFDLKGFFTEHDLDFEEQTSIRREIAPGGKSRAFINDTPVQLNTLRSLGALLVDIHSQHENSLLGDRDFQFSVVDAFAANSAVFEKYTSSFSQYKLLRKELDEVLSNEAQMRQEMDFLQFQLTELDKASLDSIDQIQLEQELDTLNNAELIRSSLASVNGLLDAENTGVILSMTNARNSLIKISSFNKSLEEFSGRLESCTIELRELQREMEAFAENVTVDEKRSDLINEKLSLIYHLEKKHRLNTVDELISLRNELQKKSEGFGNFDERIESTKKKIAEIEAQLVALTDSLSTSRKKAAKAAELEMKNYFIALSLDHAELKIELLDSTEFNAFGKNDISFLFRANKGGQLLPIKQVASGGEISRVMLAIKASISKHKKLPVLILDEIDQGVSGEVGKKIGNILKEMSNEMQLLTITHLPQIAGKASNHLKVYKSTGKDSTSTYVKEIQGEDRVNELAEMLSGKDLSKAAIANAKELMN